MADPRVLDRSAKSLADMHKSNWTAEECATELIKEIAKPRPSKEIYAGGNWFVYKWIFPMLPLYMQDYALRKPFGLDLVHFSK